MLEARGLERCFPGQRALRQVDIRLDEGRFAVVIGPSGGGKTTLIRALSMLDPPDRGRISVDGEVYEFPAARRALRRRPPWPKITVVFQQLFLWPHLTLRENITLPLASRDGRREHLEEFLDLFGMAAFVDRYPNEVSIGQRQRAALARAVITNPSYILLDEITSALDVQQTTTMTSYLQGLAGRGIGVLVVTHALALATSLLATGNGEFHFLKEGTIVESGTIDGLRTPTTTALRDFLSLPGASEGTGPR